MFFDFSPLKRFRGSLLLCEPPTPPDLQEGPLKAFLFVGALFFLWRCLAPSVCKEGLKADRSYFCFF